MTRIETDLPTIGDRGGTRKGIGCTGGGIADFCQGREGDFGFGLRLGLQIVVAESVVDDDQTRGGRCLATKRLQFWKPFIHLSTNFDRNTEKQKQDGD